jgi:lipoprotein-anchoring transpeptidase ErfK/SrfK
LIATNYLLFRGQDTETAYLIDSAGTNSVCVAELFQQMNHLLRRVQGGRIALIGILCLATDSAWAQDRHAPMAPPQQLIVKQAPPVINQNVLAQTNPENAIVLVSLSRQRAYLYGGKQLAIDTPISSGKKAGFTPAGNFTILEKDPNHRSNIYGNFVDSKGRVVRGGVSARIDSAPSGSRFVGAPMFYFMRLTSEGVGMHIGILPGYPASHGCIRMPAEIAPQIYAHVKVGTPVQVAN